MKKSKLHVIKDIAENIEAMGVQQINQRVVKHTSLIECSSDNQEEIQERLANYGIEEALVGSTYRLPKLQLHKNNTYRRLKIAYKRGKVGEWFSILQNKFLPTEAQYKALSSEELRNLTDFHNQLESIKIRALISLN